MPVCTLGQSAIVAVYKCITDSSIMVLLPVFLFYLLINAFIIDLHLFCLARMPAQLPAITPSTNAPTTTDKLPTPRTGVYLSS